MVPLANGDPMKIVIPIAAVILLLVVVLPAVMGAEHNSPVFQTTTMTLQTFTLARAFSLPPLNWDALVLVAIILIGAAIVVRLLLSRR